MRKIVDSILLLLVIFGAAALYLYKDEAVSFTRSLIRGAPCTRTITYSLGTLDARFNLNEEQALSYLSKASAVWSAVYGKQLFVYTKTKGDILVTFNYDKRQQVTDTLHTLQNAIDVNKASYQELKDEVDREKAAYENDKNAFEAAQAAFAAKQQAYNEEVAGWNRRGGASKSVYATLQTESAALQSEYAQLQSDAQKLNDETANLNTLITALNSKVATHNADAKVYNTIGATVGSEFREGEYVEAGGSREIHIYQFEDATKLVRVLEHEFGHALGLEHVSDPKAIMYALNDGIGSALTAADKEELLRVCKK